MITEILHRLLGKSKAKKPKQHPQAGSDDAQKFVGTTVYCIPQCVFRDDSNKSERYEKPTITKVETPEILKSFYNK